MKNCKFCREGLKDGASICSSCGSEQSTWLNLIKHYALLFTAIGIWLNVILSGWDWAASFYWKNDFVLKSLNSNNSVIFFNDDPHETYVDRLEIYRSEDKKIIQQINIDEVVKGKSYLKFKFPKRYEEYKARFDINESDWARLMKWELTSDEGFVVALQNDRQIQLYEKEGRNFKKFNTSIYLFIERSGSGHRLEYSGEGFFVKKSI